MNKHFDSTKGCQFLIFQTSFLNYLKFLIFLNDRVNLFTLAYKNLNDIYIQSLERGISSLLTGKLCHNSPELTLTLLLMMLYLY